MKEFVKQTLKDGFTNGSFTESQVKIYSANYMIKGVFEQTDIDEMTEYMTPAEASNEVTD